MGRVVRRGIVSSLFYERDSLITRSQFASFRAFPRDRLLEYTLLRLQGGHVECCRDEADLRFKESEVWGV